MHRLIRHRPSPALVVACVALAVALGGTSYAAVVLPAGSVGTSRLICACDWSSAETMSAPQSNVAFTSALPRLLVEWTVRTAGTARSASSMGRVTSTIMRSAGRSPASRFTRMRGKLTCGSIGRCVSSPGAWRV